MNSEFCGPEPGLIAYYKFNQGMSGGNNAGITTLLDATASQNHATLSGFSLNGATSNWVTGKALTGDSFSSQNITACNSYTSPSGQYTYTATGIYSDTIANALGCDSVITIDLTIVQLDTTITQFGAALQSNQGNAIYQWLDCNNGNSPVSGATSQTFFPSVNGTYAVAVTLSGCTDTSICYPVLNVGIGTINSDKKIRISPNPVRDILSIGLNMNFDDDITIRVRDLQGRLVLNRKINPSSGDIQLSVQELEGGIYLLVAETGDRIVTDRFIKH